MRKDGTIIPGAGPISLQGARSTPKSPNHDRATSALNNAIETLDLVSKLVPVEVVKGVLGSVAAILRTTKNVVANQSDLKELAEQCQMIGLVVWRATSGIPDHQTTNNHTLQRALSDLKRSVDGILDAVEAKTTKNIASKVFHTTVNRETIVKWRNELDRALNLFNAEVSISSSLKLDELCSLLQDFLSTTIPKPQVDDQTPEVLPAQPKIFLGRDDIVRDTIHPLLQFRDVALIGTGGIGKSYIARTVLYDKAIISKFRNMRFFVRYDDMDAAKITCDMFLDRIARILGLTTSGNTHNSINKALSISDTLLVLDNAETFLDAAKDASLIADAIDGFGARSNVAILLTTRNTVLPPNLNWVRLRVLPLEEDAACEAFKCFYTPSIETSDLIKLLSAVDFHPLSINLLAQAAVQNDWSPEDLADAWDRQRTALLETGDGKIQSNAVTIETSLNSPSISKIGDTIYHLLQIIAFLPQGISKKRLSAMLPGVSDIESYADALCRHSLTYLNGDFITLLAPVRLYISKRYNTQVLANPLLERIRRYYAAHVNEEKIVRQDDVNMEHILTHWVGDPKCMVYVLGLISDFVYTLLDCRPRPVSFRPVISSLSPDKTRHSILYTDFFKFFAYGQSLRRLQASLEKGSCLFAMSTLLRSIGQIADAEDTLAEAQAVLLRTKRHGRLRLIIVNWGVALVYTEQGNYQAAEELFLSAMCMKPNRYFKILLRFGLAQVKMLKGEPDAVKSYLEALPTVRKIMEPNILIACYCNAGYAELHNGHSSIAKIHFEEAQAVDKKSIEGVVMSLLGLGDVADYKSDHTQAKSLRERALGLVQNMPDCTVAFVSEAAAALAGYLAMEGTIEEARKLIVPAVANASKHLSTRVQCIYMEGMIELIAGDFHQAQSYFQETLEECDSIEEFSFRARSERALGEIAIVKGDLATARKHFEATTELCKRMGLPRECLYRSLACYIPNEAFNGWKLYQENAMSRT